MNQSFKSLILMTSVDSDSKRIIALIFHLLGGGVHFDNVDVASRYSLRRCVNFDRTKLVLRIKAVRCSDAGQDRLQLFDPLQTIHFFVNLD